MIPPINKKLLPIKGHYLFFNAATAPVIPFLPVMARQLGFSGTIVGVIYTVLPIVGMIAKPVLGGIADRFRCKKMLFILFQIITAVSLLGINYIPPLPKNSRVHFACNSGESVFDVQNKSVEDTCVMENAMSHLKKIQNIGCKMNCDHLTKIEYETMCTHWKHDLKVCNDSKTSFSFNAIVPKNNIEIFDAKQDKFIIFKVVQISLRNGALIKPLCPDKVDHISTSCDISCDVDAINELLSVPRSQDYDVLGEYQFWTFISLAIFGWGGMAVVVSIGDAICFEMLGDSPNLYGYQRLWGSVGWGLFSILAGLMVDNYSEGQYYKDYTSVFYLMLGMMAIDVLISYKLRYKQEHMSSNIFRDVAKVLTRLRVFIYLIWCIFVGICTGLIWNFLFWHLEDVAKAYDDMSGECGLQSWIKTLEGLVMGIQCLGGELPFFFLSSWILERIGHVHCMSLVLLGIGVRYVMYSVLVNPWWVLPIELMNGVTFGLFYATMASYASIVAPPGTEATVQGLVGAVFEGIGVSLGSLIGGILYDSYDGWITFRIFGIASFICCAVHVLIQYLLSKKEKLSTDFDTSITHYVPPKEAIRILDGETQVFTLIDD